MNRLTPFTQLPEVKDAVISDKEGTLIEHTGTKEAESVAAVMSFFVSGLDACGDALGFGKPLKVCCTGNNLSCVLFVHDNMIWTVYLDAGASQSAFERKLDSFMKNTEKSGKGGLR